MAKKSAKKSASLIGRRIRMKDGSGLKYAPDGAKGTIIDPATTSFRGKDGADVDRDGDYWAVIDNGPLGDSPACIGGRDKFKLIEDDFE